MDTNNKTTSSEVVKINDVKYIQVIGDHTYVRCDDVETFIRNHTDSERIAPPTNDLYDQFQELNKRSNNLYFMIYNDEYFVYPSSDFTEVLKVLDIATLIPDNYYFGYLADLESKKIADDDNNNPNEEELSNGLAEEIRQFDNSLRTFINKYGPVVSTDWKENSGWRRALYYSIGELSCQIKRGYKALLENARLDSVAREEISTEISLTKELMFFKMRRIINFYHRR